MTAATIDVPMREGLIRPLSTGYHCIYVSTGTGALEGVILAVFDLARGPAENCRASGRRKGASTCQLSSTSCSPFLHAGSLEGLALTSFPVVPGLARVPNIFPVAYNPVHPSSKLGSLGLGQPHAMHYHTLFHTLALFATLSSASHGRREPTYPHRSHALSRSAHPPGLFAR